MMVNTRRGFREFAVAIALLATVVSVTIWSFTMLAIPSTAHVNLPAFGPPLNPCDMIKGKTYIAFTTGQFDAHPNAASAGKWTFDSQGNGTGRSLLVYEPTDQVVLQQMPTVTCTVSSDGVTGVLSFMVGSTSAGSAKFTVHDHGAKLWAEPTTPGRPMNGWMLQLPESRAPKN
jgi:hypothetical protein